MTANHNAKHARHGTQAPAFTMEAVLGAILTPERIAHMRQLNRLSDAYRGGDKVPARVLLADAQKKGKGAA